MYRRALAATAVCLTIAVPLAAQQPARPAADSSGRAGTEVAFFHLGADTAEHRVSLHAGEVYRVETFPAAALTVRSAIPGDTNRAPVLTPVDSAHSRFVLTPPRHGEYDVALAAPLPGPFTVRIVHIGGAPQMSEAASEAIFEPEHAIFDGTAPIANQTVILAAGVAYRIEITGAGTSPSVIGAVSFGPRYLDMQEPLVVTTLSDQAWPIGGVAALVVPRVSGEYRLDVAYTSALLRVKIVTDPRETRRWSNMVAQTQDLAAAGVSLRFTWLGPFVTGGARHSADGFGVCLAAVPRGAWLGGNVGGCALTITSYRGVSRSYIFFGIAPQILVSAPRTSVDVAIVPQFAFGGSTTSGVSEDFYSFGVGLLFSRPLAGRLRIEAELGARHIETRDGNYGDGSATPPYLEAGLQWRP